MKINDQSAWENQDETQNYGADSLLSNDRATGETADRGFSDEISGTEDDDVADDDLADDDDDLLDDDDEATAGTDTDLDEDEENRLDDTEGGGNNSDL